MLIDCEQCAMQGTSACDDCVVTFLLSDGPVDLDESEVVALANLAVPNTLAAGLHWGLDFHAAAAAVAGSIALTAGGASEDDYYSFAGRAGDVVSIELFSELRRRRE